MYIQLMVSYDKGEEMENIENVVQAALSGELTEIDIKEYRNGPLSKTVSVIKAPDEVDYLRSMTLE